MLQPSIAPLAQHRSVYFEVPRPEVEFVSRVVTKSKSSGAEQSWEADVLVVSAPIPALQR